MTDSAISVQNITKTFDFKKHSGLASVIKSTKASNNLIALHNISFNVGHGEILGIIGLNGSGKTTLLRTIAGIYQPDSGKIIVNGKIAPLLQIGAGFQPELTGPENIVISGMLYGFSKREIQEKIDSVIEFAELQEFVEMDLKHYSTGMRARLAFSLALQLDPDILLVDEVISVGDTAFRKKSQDAFLSFKRKNKTVILATHILSILPELCENVMFLDHGKIVEIGKPESVIAKYREHSLKNKKI